MTRRLPGLDALRGLAAAWVVLHHAALVGAIPGAALLDNGWLGVDLFLALSGFLLAAQHQGRPPLRLWYERRLRRLLPLHLVVLAGIAAPLWWLGRLDVAHPVLLLTAPNAAMGGDAPLELQVLWSLGVEYHAYLLLPPLVRSRRGLVAIVGVILAGPVVRAAVGGGAAAYVGTLCRLDGLAWGCLAAWAAGRWSTVLPRPANLRAVHLVPLAVLALLAAAMWPIGREEWVWSVIGYTGAGAVSAAFVWWASTWTRAPEVLQALGRWSYSWYLLHYLVLLVCSRVLPGWAAVAATVVVAWAGHRFVELPFTRQGSEGAPSRSRSGRSVGDVRIPQLAGRSGAVSNRV